MESSRRELSLLMIPAASDHPNHMTMMNTTGYIRKLLQHFLNLMPQDRPAPTSPPPDQLFRGAQRTEAQHLLFDLSKPARRAKTAFTVLRADTRQPFYQVQFVRKLQDILEKHLSEPDFQVEKLSKEMGMSRVHLYRRLKTVSGQSPSAYMRNFRLHHAARLLSVDACNVSEAAYQSGFNDLSHFSKCFKKTFGICPSHYQRYMDKEKYHRAEKPKRSNTHSMLHIN